MSRSSIILVVLAMLIGQTSIHAFFISNYKNLIIRNVKSLTMSNDDDQLKLSKQVANIMIGLSLSTAPIMNIPFESLADTATKSATTKSTTPTKVAAKPALLPVERELLSLGLKQSDELKIAEELAVENAVSNKYLIKAKQEDLTKEINTVKTKLLTDRNEVKKLQSQLDRLNKKLQAKDLDNIIRVGIVDDANEIKRDISKIKPLILKSESIIDRDTKEIASIKKRVVELDAFAREKVKQAKLRRVEIEKSKKLEAEKKAKKIADEKLALKLRAISTAEGVVNGAQRDVNFGETSVKITQVKLKNANELLKSQQDIERKAVAKVAAAEAQLKKEQEILAKEDKKVAELEAKVAAADAEVKKTLDNLVTKKANLVAASNNLNSLK